MDKMRSILIGTLLIVSFFTPSYADVPKLINYQGHLADKAGSPLTGTVSITFSIYDSDTGGNNLWTETQTLVDIKNGLFNVLLGSASVDGVPESLFDGPDRWLGVAVQGDSEVVPRQQLVSVPYAYKAGSASSIDSGQQFIQTGNFNTNGEIVLTIPLNVSNGNIYKILIKGHMYDAWGSDTAKLGIRFDGDTALNYNDNGLAECVWNATPGEVRSRQSDKTMFYIHNTTILRSHSTALSWFWLEFTLTAENDVVFLNGTGENWDNQNGELANQEYHGFYNDTIDTNIQIIRYTWNLDPSQQEIYLDGTYWVYKQNLP